jgi:HAMP domain-containing protein
MRLIYRFFGRFQTKLIFVFVSAMIIVCAASGFFIYRHVSDFVFEKLRSDLVELASISSTRVDAETLLSIPLEPEGVQSAAYQKIEKDLERIQQAAPSIKYIYIFSKDPLQQNILRFVVDVSAEDGADEYVASPGDEYDATNFPELIEAFEGPIADRSITTDEWGAFLSGYVPIIDKNKEAVAVLGVDMKAEDVYRIQDGIKRYLILSLIFGILLSIVLAIFMSGGIAKNVKLLGKGFQRVAAGDLDYNVKVKGNDELSDLAQFFNKMSVDLKGYVRELQKTTSEKERLLSELNIARDIQQGFLPEFAPVISGIDIAAATRPARVVGGDFYDFIPISKDRYGIVIADVSGKGVPAALFVALSRAIIMSSRNLFDTPDMVVKHANAGMIELSRSSMFETLFYGVLDAKNMAFSYANAGHNPPFILSVPKTDPVLLNAQTFPIGINPDMEISTKMQQLKSGDAMVLYTDGITEAMNIENEEYGELRLTDIVRKNTSMSSKDIIEEINKDIELFQGNAEQHDDMTIIVIKAM